MRWSVSQVDAALVDPAWSALEPYIRKGVSLGGDTTEPEMKAAIRRGDMQMWVVHEGSEIQAGIVISVVDGAERKVWVELLAGKGLDEWVGGLERLLADFRDLIGASCIEASCRLGLAKYLKGRGWKRKAVVMRLER